MPKVGDHVSDAELARRQSACDPGRVEEFLYTHPKLANVQVFGVPDLKYGGEVMAWV